MSYINFIHRIWSSAPNLFYNIFNIKILVCYVIFVIFNYCSALYLVSRNNQSKNRIRSSKWWNGCTIYIKSKRRGDSRSFGRWDDSWVGYMIACWAERYVNGASPFISKNAMKYTKCRIRRGNPCFMVWLAVFLIWTDWVSHRWWFDYQPPLSTQFQPQKPLIFMNLACESWMIFMQCSSVCTCLSNTTCC